MLEPAQEPDDDAWDCEQNADQPEPEGEVDGTRSDLGTFRHGFVGPPGRSAPRFGQRALKLEATPAGLTVPLTVECVFA